METRVRRAAVVAAILLSGTTVSSQTPSPETPVVSFRVNPPVARIGQSSAVTVLGLSSGRLGIGRGDGEVEIWDTESRKTLMTRSFEGRIVVALSPDLSTAATLVRGQYAIEVWDLRSGELQHTLTEGHGLVVLDVAFSPNAKTLGVAVGQFYFGGVHLWDLDTGKLLHKLEEVRDDVGMTCGVTSMRFISGGSTVLANDTVSPGRNSVGVVGLWDTGTGKWQTSLTGEENPVAWKSLSVSPDEKTVAVIDRKKVRLLSMDTRVQRSELELSVRLRQSRVIPYSGFWTDRELDLAFSPEGDLLATSNGTVEVWDVTSGKRRLTLPGSVGATRLAFLPDGQFLACGYLNGTVKIWKVRQ